MHCAKLASVDATVVTKGQFTAVATVRVRCRHSKHKRCQVHKVPGTQGARYTRFQVHKVPGTQGSRYTRCQVHKVPGTQGARYTRKSA